MLIVEYQCQVFRVADLNWTQYLRPQILRSRVIGVSMQRARAVGDIYTLPYHRASICQRRLRLTISYSCRSFLVSAPSINLETCLLTFLSFYYQKSSVQQHFCAQ